MEIVKAYASKNAVKVAAIAIEFSESLSNNQMDMINDKIHQDPFFKHEFGNIQTQQRISVTIGPDGIPKNEQDSGGVICNKITDEHKNTWTLTIGRDFILIACKEYTRWKDVSATAFEYITKVSMLIEKHRIVSQIVLEYLDEFLIINNKEDWGKALFSESCQYLLPNIFLLKDFWHINHGYFVKIDDIDSKILDNIDISYFADENDNLRHKANIRTQHKLRYTTPKELNIETIKHDVQKIHDHSKSIFNIIVNKNIIATFE